MEVVADDDEGLGCKNLLLGGEHGWEVASPKKKNGLGDTVADVVQAVDLTGLLDDKVATVVLNAATDSDGVEGTLLLTHRFFLDNLRISGSITGLNAGESINIHARRSGNVADGCANQGDFFNPNMATNGGFLVSSATADDSGTATIEDNTPAALATLWPYFGQSLYTRSIRVSTNDNSGSPQDGTARACGAVNKP
ncbi:unnamed protein product [Notodromas monacha]|uniref:Superoxide dismutase copper/zinc binding domain-containing protein n=1 Tax=Notodromas monacha TaxID=399045 RepID=A0A7R9BN02_9CRUS|nr:unnamed protein product [Notodromas monacha]CAG0916988.1 unnamed protein product [Notodromas monacha]